MRIDVPHLRSIESSIAADFDVVAGRVQAGEKAVVIRGFGLANFTAGTNANSVQLSAGDGILYNMNATEAGTFLWVPADRAVETLNSATNGRVTGSFTAGQVNYIGLDLTRSADSTTTDLVQFLDSNTLLENSKNVPLGRTLDYRIVISTSPFSSSPNLVPIAKIKTDASNNVDSAAGSVQDARNILWRLGAGGDFPNRYNSFSWAQNRVESTSGSDVFAGGDKAIQSQKDWMDAVMTRLWEIGGGENWYSTTADRNVRMVRAPGTVFSTTGDNFEWVAGAYSVNHLHWKGLKIAFDNSNTSSCYYNTVNDQTGDDLAGTAVASKTALADGECLYVDIDRTANSGLTAKKAALQTLSVPAIPGSRIILAWRIGTSVFSRDSVWAVNVSFQPATTTVAGAVRLNYDPNISMVSTPTVFTLDTNNALTVGGAAYPIVGSNAGATITGGGTGAGITVTGGSGGGIGISATGTGAAAGISVTGGATDGTGISATAGGTAGVGISVTATTGTGLSVSNTTGIGIAINNTTGTGLSIINTTGGGLTVSNTGSGTGITITKTGSGNAASFNASSGTGKALILQSASAICLDMASGSGTGINLFTSSGSGLVITAGGQGASISSGGAFLGLNVVGGTGGGATISAGTGATALALTGTTGTGASITTTSGTGLVVSSPSGIGATISAGGVGLVVTTSGSAHAITATAGSAGGYGVRATGSDYNSIVSPNDATFNVGYGAGGVFVAGQVNGVGVGVAGYGGGTASSHVPTAGAPDGQGGYFVGVSAGALGGADGVLSKGGSATTSGAPGMGITTYGGAQTGSGSGGAGVRSKGGQANTGVGGIGVVGIGGNSTSGTGGRGGYFAAGIGQGTTSSPGGLGGDFIGGNQSTFGADAASVGGDGIHATGGTTTNTNSRGGHGGVFTGGGGYGSASPYQVGGHGVIGVGAAGGHPGIGVIGLAAGMTVSTNTEVFNETPQGAGVYGLSDTAAYYAGAFITKAGTGTALYAVSKAVVGSLGAAAYFQGGGFGTGSGQRYAVEIYSSAPTLDPAYACLGLANGTYGIDASGCSIPIAMGSRTTDPSGIGTLLEGSFWLDRNTSKICCVMNGVLKRTVALT